MFTRSRFMLSKALPLKVHSMSFILSITSVNYISFIQFQNAFMLERQNETKFLYSITTRHRSTTPINTIIMFVPQQEVRFFIVIKCAL